MSTENQIEGVKGLDSITEFYENNKKNINIAGIGLILAAIGLWWYFNKIIPARATEAQDSFFMAERYYQQDSLDKALNGDGINLGMIDIADEYGSTKVGDMANYYAGRILLQKDQYNEAIEYLDNVAFTDEFMAAQVITLKGDCYSELGEYKKAGDVYMKAANKRDNKLSSPIALKKAAYAFEEANAYEDAIEALERIEDEYYNFSQGLSIDLRKAKLKAKMASQ